jgi:GT2 family glycosyltransferase/glycosyltransferase involved in cell wall biosynthesis
MTKSLNMIDVIIVNFKSTDYLLHCLKSTYNSLQQFPGKVFVQDNASEDGVDRVKAAFPQVILSKNSYNMGFSKAINRVLKQSNSPYVVLLNPDTYVMDGLFEPIIHYMENNPEVGVVGPKILDPDGSIQGSARSFPTPLTALFGRSSLLTSVFPNNPLSRTNILTTISDGRTPMTVDWVSGACMIVRRKAVDDIGLMDERFFMYWEDADWCRRMWKKGWKVVYFPQSSIIHYIGVSSGQAFLRSIFEFHKSSYRLFNKYSNTSWFMKPLAITGISLHLFYVLVSKRFYAWHKKFAVAKMHLKQVPVVEKKEKIKVLRVIARLNIGGPAIHVHLLTEGLDRSKFQSILVTGKISPREGDMSYLFSSVDTNPITIPELQREISFKLDVKALIQIFKILRREKPDIVHTHTAKAGSSTRLAVFLYNLICDKKVLIVHTFHGHVFEGYFSRLKSFLFVWIERLMAKETDVIVGISETQKKDLADKYNIAPYKKIKKVELGFDLKPFLHGKALKGQFRKKMGIDDNTILIGIVGRLVPIKNHSMFLKGAKIFLERNQGIKVKFIVVGDGELRNELEDYCGKMRLSNYVHFCGWMRDISFVYADLDILALTSLNEGTPVSIIEAMASSVPVISTDAGGVLDLLGPLNGSPFSNSFMVHKRGIVCRKNDAFGLASGLEYLLERDIKEKEECLAKARSFVEHRFSEERLLHDIESLYLEMMQ